MKLLAITIKNFLSMEEVGIEFPTGIVSVIGSNRDVSGASSNGSGKSTLFDAISWGLFGKMLRPVSADDVMRRGTNQAHVAVLVEINGREYSIERFRGKKTGLKVWAYDPEEEMTQATPQMTQAMVDQLLGVDYKTFLSVATFDLDVLRFARATDKEQKEILERLLDLDFYNRGLEKVRKEIKEKDQLLTSAKDTIVYIKNNVSNLQAEKERLQASLLQLEKDIALKAQTTHDQIINTKALIVQEEAKILTNEATLKKPSPVVPEEDKTFAMNMLSAQMREKELSRRASELATRIAVKDRELTTAENKIGKPCGECNRPITKAELNSVMESIAMESIKLMDEEKEVRTQLVNQQLIVKTNTKLYDDYTAGRKVYQDTIKDWNLLVNNARLANESSRAKIHSWKNAIMTMENETNTLRASGEKWKALLNDKDVQLFKANEQMEDKYKVIDNINQDMLILKFWEKGFGYQGIRSVLLDNVAEVLTKKTNDYLKSLMGGSLWINCSTQSTNKDGEKRERFEVQTFNSYGAGTYFGNSKGEQQRIDIGLALALHSIARDRSKNPIDFIILDEIFERLDEVGCESIVSLLHKERSTIGTVFVVSHNPNITHRLPQCIEFVKKNGITSCVESKPRSTSTPTTKPSLPSQPITSVTKMTSRKTGIMKEPDTLKSR